MSLLHGCLYYTGRCQRKDFIMCTEMDIMLYMTVPYLLKLLFKIMLISADVCICTCPAHEDIQGHNAGRNIYMAPFLFKPKIGSCYDIYIPQYFFRSCFFTLFLMYLKQLQFTIFGCSNGWFRFSKLWVEPGQGASLDMSRGVWAKLIRLERSTVKECNQTVPCSISGFFAREGQERLLPVILLSVNTG